MIKRIAAIISVATCAGLIMTFVPQLSTIEKAFATAHAVSTHNSAVDQPPAERSCSDFDFWFLNSTCSKVRTKRAARTKHHVATFVSGHSVDAQIASAKR
jgi:hypothetical protein